MYGETGSRREKMNKQAAYTIQNTFQNNTHTAGIAEDVSYTLAMWQPALVCETTSERALWSETPESTKRNQRVNRPVSMHPGGVHTRRARAGQLE